MPRYDTCPVCGSLKRSISKGCNKCRFSDTRYSAKDAVELPTDSWLTEFSGLFWGEGSALIVKNNASYTALLSLGLRADNAPVLEEIQKYLGGTIVHSDSAMKKNPNASPALSWKVTGLKEVLRVSQLILSHSSFPAKKRIEVQQVVEFCEWRLPEIYTRISDEDRARMESMCLANKATRMFD